MSDALILGLVLGAFTMLTALLTIVLNGINERRQVKLLHELKVAQQKIDDLHKEVNSKLSQLVKAEKTISHDEGFDQGVDKGTAEGIRQAETLINYDKGKEGKTNGPNKEPEEDKESTGVKKNLDQAKGKIDEAKKKLDDL